MFRCFPVIITGAPRPPLVAFGLYSLTTAGANVDPGILSSANVDGVSIRQDWSDLAPTASGGNPVYNWTYLDAQVASVTASGKNISLRILTGSGAVTESQGHIPDWVMAKVDAASGATFSFLDTNSGNIVRRIPVHWDPTFLAEKRKMLQDLGTRYSNNLKVKIVFIGFANAQTADWSVPDSSTLTAAEIAAGFTTTEVQRWTAAGYTTQKVIDAGCATGNALGLIDVTVAAFPNSKVVFAGGTTRTALDPAGVRVAAETAFGNGLTKYGSGVGIQKNDLSQKTAANQPFSGQPTENDWRILYDERPNVGAQMLSVANATRFVVTGYAGTVLQALTAAIDCGHDYGTHYQEIYEPDILDNTLSSAIVHAHTILV